MITIIGVVFIIFLALIFLRVPIGYAIGVAGLVGYYLGDMRLDSAAPALSAGLESFPLLAIPAFLFAGDLMAQGGISSAIINLIQVFLGRLRGGLGSVLVSSSMLFGAITGSSLATISAIGGIMYTPMLKDGYSRPYITALLAASGFLGILIPPSVPGVVYALVTEQKVTDIWMSTLMPGLALGLLYIVVNYLVFGRKQLRPAGVQTMAGLGSRLSASLPKASVAFVMPLIIFGGVYGAYFSKLNYLWSKHVRNKTWLKTHPTAEVLLVTLLTTATCFLNRYTRMGGPELVYNLFAECTSEKAHEGLCVREQEQLHVVLSAIAVTLVVKGLLTIITFGIKVPAGIFIPTLGVGACFGRIVGIALQTLQQQNPDLAVFSFCKPGEKCIIPGIYAMVGAAATLSGVTVRRS
jgi:TRAP-type mannitol/chloroaromatic compound transport system permease large subunit